MWTAPSVDLDPVAQRPEQSLDEIGAPAHRQGRHQRGQRDRLLHQVRTLLAPPAQRRAQRLRDRHREERRGRVRPIVDVLIEQAPVLAAAPHEADWIDIEQEREGAALVGCLGIEHMRAAERQLQLVAANRVLV
jgi:hypothetical protein